MHYDYIKWFALFAWAPLAIVWVIYWPLLAKYLKVLGWCIVGSFIFGTAWDYWATHSWLWHFSPEHTLGYKLLGLPIEEYIFFVSYTVLYGSIALVLRDKILRREK